VTGWGSSHLTRRHRMQCFRIM